MTAGYLYGWIFFRFIDVFELVFNQIILYIRRAQQLVNRMSCLNVLLRNKREHWKGLTMCQVYHILVVLLLLLIYMYIISREMSIML